MKRVFLVMALIIGSLQIQAQKFDKMDKSPMDRAYYPSNAALRAFEKTAEKKKSRSS